MDFATIPKLVINLDKRKDRMSLFDEMFKVFFKDQTYTRIRAREGNPSRKYIAESHKRAVKFAKDSGFECVCIMEDDVEFTSKESFEYLQSCLDSIDFEWDVLLGGTFQGIADETKHPWVRIKDFSGMHFYILKKESFDAILNMKDENLHIDRWLASQSGLKCYRTEKIFAVQRNGFSDNVNRNVAYKNLIDKKELL